MHRFYRNNLFVTIISILVVLGLVLSFAIIVRRLSADNASAIDAQNAVARYEHNQTAWEAAKTTFASDQIMLNALQSTVITPDTVPTFLSTLEDLAVHSSVTFSISNVSTDKINKTPALTVTLESTGTRDNLAAFLHSLETLPQQVSFSSFLLAESTDIPEKGQQPSWQANVKIRVLSFTDQQL